MSAGGAAVTNDVRSDGASRSKADGDVGRGATVGSDGSPREEDLDVTYESYVLGRGGSKTIRKILIANNGCTW